MNGGPEQDWAERILARWTAFAARRRWAFAAVLVAAGLVCSWLARGVKWQADLLAFFSADSGEVRDVQAAARDQGLATQLRLDVHGPDVEAAADELCTRLKGSGEFQTVWNGVDISTMAAAFERLRAQAPAILSEGEQKTIEARANEKYLAQRFADVRGHLADPDGELLLRKLAADPLDIAGLVAAKLAGLGSANQAGEMGLANGKLVARDAAGGEHVMIVLQPVAPPSDQRGAERTMAAVWKAVAELEGKHSGAGVWVVGAHRAYVENAQRVKRDVEWVSVLGTLAVAAAILVFFWRGGWRGLRGAGGCVILCMAPPSVGVGLALGLAGAIHVELPLILLGFAGLLCGSTTDYGIQILARCRRMAAAGGGDGGRWNESIPARAARGMLGPISMSVATSVTGFAAVGLSDAPGLRAMGLFVAAATICIWVVTFFVLPPFIAPWMVAGREAESSAGARSGHFRKWAMAAGLAGFIVVTGLLGRAALHVPFDGNPRALDGSSAALLADENAFYRVWGDLRNRAMVQVHGHDAGEALERLQAVQAYLGDQTRDGLIAGVISPAGVLPDDAAAARGAGTWRTYWTAERRADLARWLSAAATASGMKPESFTDYPQHLGDVAVAPAAQRLADSPVTLFPGFVSERSGGVTISSIVEMRKDRSPRLTTGWGPELRLRFADWEKAGDPGLTILSGNLLIFDAVDRARAEGERLLPLCLVAILLPLCLYFRGLRKAWLAMLCLVVGLVWVLGSAALFGQGLNLLALVPVLFALGVAVDYGIYMATAGADPAGRSSATFLCASTTTVGSGALILAGHPALRWLGMTLVAGIAGGYLTSLLVVGPIARWLARGNSGLERGRARWFAWTGRMALRGALLLLTLALVLPVWAEWRLSREKPAGISEPLAREQPLKRPAARVYETGQSWMRWRDAGNDSGLWEIRLAGTAAERGAATARLAAPLDYRIENEMLDQLDYFLPQEWSRWLVLRAVGVNMVSLPSYVSAEDQREIYAAARSYDDPHRYLAPTYPRILSYHALHDISQTLIDNPLIVPSTFACTGVVSLPSYTAPRDGHLMLARVFDFEGGESFGRQKSITYVIPPQGDGIPFAHIAWPGLSGAVTGMNVEKIALFINAAATGDYRRIGTPTILMARDILQHARTIDEVEKTIRETQVFVSDIIVAADGKTGEARIFEKSPARFAAYPVKGSAVVTNHLVSPAFASDPVNRERIDEGTTLQRYTRARELLDQLKEKVTSESLAALMRDKKGVGGKDLGLGNRNAIDGLIACHGVIMDVTAGRMWVAAWPYVEGQFMGIDVMAMLNRGGVKSDFQAAIAPSTIAEDSMMDPGPSDSRSGWQRLLQSRAAAEKAEAALAAGDLASALKAADEVVALDSAFYLGHELRGRALFKRGDRAAAKAELMQAMDCDPPYLQRRQAIEGLIKQCDVH